MKQPKPTVFYTGHPFVDAGVAVLEHYLEKPCEEFTDQDLERAGRWLAGLYSRRDLGGYLTLHFPNSGWCNFKIGEEKKQANVDSVLRSYNAPPLPERHCVYCRRPAQFLADRQHIPLLTGATVIIASPGGVPGLPVCGYCLLAVQFYPLATLKCSVKPLFWWTPDPELTYHLTGEYHRQIMQQLSAGSDKLPNLSWPRTRLLETADRVLETYGRALPLADCIGYHVTNYGSGPDYHQYRIPRELLEFWLEVRAQTETVRRAHRRVIENGWENMEKGGRRGRKAAAEEAATGRRNSYYEALVEAFAHPDWPQQAGLIVKRFYLFKAPGQLAENNYGLSALFLEKVGGMEKKRLEVIRQIADLMARTLVLGNNEARWLDELYRREMRPAEFLRYLVRVQKRLAEKGQAFSLEEVLCMLDMTSEEDSGPRDAWLVQSLMLIRLLEVVGREKQELLQAMNGFQEGVEEV
ncbi:MAG: hypothetical protein ACOY81_00595 [Bacillota bacterium]